MILFISPYLYHVFVFVVVRSKYFRGKKIHGDWDIRVEQSEFRDLSINAASDGGAMVALTANGGKLIKLVIQQ